MKSISNEKDGDWTVHTNKKKSRQKKNGDTKKRSYHYIFQANNAIADMDAPQDKPVRIETIFDQTILQGKDIMNWIILIWSARENYTKCWNYLFYTNQLQSSPHGDYIDNIHTRWYGNWGLLEDHYGYAISISNTEPFSYIQWLFPVFESGGMNSQSDALNKVSNCCIHKMVLKVVKSQHLFSFA